MRHNLEAVEEFCLILNEYLNQRWPDLNCAIAHLDDGQIRIFRKNSNPLEPFVSIYPESNAIYPWIGYNPKLDEEILRGWTTAFPDKKMWLYRCYEIAKPNYFDIVDDAIKIAYKFKL